MVFKCLALFKRELFHEVFDCFFGNTYYLKKLFWKRHFEFIWASNNPNSTILNCIENSRRFFNVEKNFLIAFIFIFVLDYTGFTIEF